MIQFNMLMYFACLSVLYLPLDVNYIIKTDEQLFAAYKDLRYESINITNYCNDKPCVLKCCGDGEVLNNDSNCRDVHEFKAMVHDPKTNGSALSWDGAAELKKQLNVDVRLVRNEDTFSPSLKKLRDNTFYLLKDGSLRVKSRTDTAQWFKTSPLAFCVDFGVHGSGEEQKLMFSFKLKRDSAQNIGQFNSFVIGIGILCALWMLPWSLYLSPRFPKIIFRTEMAATITQANAYLLEIFLIISLNTGYLDCRYITPALYYYILSTFVWQNMLSFKAMWEIRMTRVRVKLKINLSTLSYYCWVGWGVPLLATLALLAIDKLEWYKTMSLEKPPFDTCFTSAKETWTYVYAPMSILTITVAIMCSLKYYYKLNVPRLDRIQETMIHKLTMWKFIRYFRKKKIGLRAVVITRLISLMILNQVYEYMSHAPVVFVAAINVYIYLFSIDAYDLISHDKTLFIRPCRRFFGFEQIDFEDFVMDANNIFNEFYYKYTLA